SGVPTNSRRQPPSSWGYLSRRDELDRPRLDLEQRREQAGFLAVEVDAHLLRRSHGYPLAVHELVVGVVLVQMGTVLDGPYASDGLDLAGIADEDHVKDTVGRRRGRRHAHAAAEVLAVGDYDLHGLEVMSNSVDDHIHRFVLPAHQRHERRHLERRAPKPLAPAIDAAD